VAKTKTVQGWPKLRDLAQQFHCKSLLEPQSWPIICTMCTIFVRKRSGRAQVVALRAGEIAGCVLDVYNVRRDGSRRVRPINARPLRSKRKFMNHNRSKLAFNTEKISHV
jgi:hypothetical protein